MSNLQFELNDDADQWLCKGLRINRHGIHFGSAKSVTWEALDKLRAVVGGEYPVACTHPEGHYFGSYGMNKCQRCGLSQMQVYGPAQMAEWEEKRKKHAEFERSAQHIVAHLLQRGWHIVGGDEGVLTPPAGDAAEQLPPPDTTIMYWHSYEQRSWPTAKVGSWLVEQYRYLLDVPLPPLVSPNIRLLDSVPQPTSRPNWFERFFQ